MSKPALRLSRRSVFTLAAVGAGTVLIGPPALAATPVTAAGSGRVPAAGREVAQRQAALPTSYVVKPFAESAVRLGSGIFAENRDRMLNFARKYPVDSILYNFRVTAGLNTLGAAPMGSWEEPASLLRGHFTGHYLSMLAQAHAGSTGGTEFADRITYVISALGQCQDALAAAGQSGAGYLAAYPEQQFDQLQTYTTYPTIWAPWYTCHKILAGLLACYDLAGNTQALEIAKKLGTWTFNRLSATTLEQRQRMWGMYIAGEYGGMNESLMRLHEITGTASYLTAAKFFDMNTLLDACAAGTDTLDGKHANQHIPQFLGYLKVFEATGEQKYLDAVTNFWDMVVPHRTYAHGGTGQGEIFRARDKVAGTINKETNAETCAAYNMLKVSRGLFFHHADAKYMEYYEKALFNQILGSRKATASDNDPMVTYMLPVGPGVRRGYGNFGTCCGGTGLENHTKYQDSIYFAAADDSALYVNLFIASTLTWAAKGVTITQQTQMPVQGSSTLTVTGSATFGLKLRVPAWATNGYTVAINGSNQNLTAQPGSYLTINRSWNDGDTVTVTMPMSLRLERTVDDPALQSVANGPIALVARSGQGSYRKMSFYPTMSLAGSLSRSLVPAAQPGFFTGTDGTVFAPLYVGSDDAYHLYFQRAEQKVTFGGIDSGIANPARTDKSTLLDDIWAQAPFTDRTEFQSTVIQVAQDWSDEGRLSRRDRQAIVLAAGRARF